MAKDFSVQQALVTGLIESEPLLIAAHVHLQRRLAHSSRDYII